MKNETIKTFQIYYINKKGHNNTTFVDALNIEDARTYGRNTWKENFVDVKEYVKIKNRLKK